MVDGGRWGMMGVGGREGLIRACEASPLEFEQRKGGLGMVRDG